MKKFVLFAALVFSVSASFASTATDGVEPEASSTEWLLSNSNSYIPRAKAALRRDCGSVPAGWDLIGSASTISSCFAGGFITRVTIYANSPCPPNLICIQIVQEIGYVDFGCDGEIISVNCGLAPN